MSAYYKSLISDEEVLRELIKESKRRERKFSVNTRLKPNLTCFRRMVSHLVTNNKKIDKDVRQLQRDSRTDPQEIDFSAPIVNSKPVIDYRHRKRLMLERKINFVKANDSRKKTTQYRKESENITVENNLKPSKKMEKCSKKISVLSFKNSNSSKTNNSEKDEVIYISSDEAE